MASGSNLVLAQVARPHIVWTRNDVQLVSMPHLGCVKFQTLDDATQDKAFDLLGVLPVRPNQEIQTGPLFIAGLAPREWLITASAEVLDDLTVRLNRALGSGGLVTNLTHGRSIFVISGKLARFSLSAHCPLNTSDEAFPIGSTARTLFGQTGVFISHQPGYDNQSCFRLIVDQTMAAYVQRLLAQTS